jgi:transcriptional regulator with XRE-family HTH domain
MSELTNRQKNEFAKTIFLSEHVTQKEIAERVGVSQATLSKWANEEKWELLKTSISITREEQISNLHLQIAAINKVISEREKGTNFATPREADTLNKLATAIEKMERETGVAEVIDVSKAILHFVRKTDSKKAIEISGYFDAYIKEILK